MWGLEFRASEVPLAAFLSVSKVSCMFYKHNVALENLYLSVVQPVGIDQVFSCIMYFLPSENQFS